MQGAGKVLRRSSGCFPRGERNWLPWLASQSRLMSCMAPASVGGSAAEKVAGEQEEFGKQDATPRARCALRCWQPFRDGKWMHVPSPERWLGQILALSASHLCTTGREGCSSSKAGSHLILGVAAGPCYGGQKSGSSTRSRHGPHAQLKR